MSPPTLQTARLTLGAAAPANAASVRVAEKLGATLEGPHQPDGGKPVMRWRHLAGVSGHAPTYGVPS